ncbi:Tetraspanin 74F [Carabus blaptoides fortunei]
MGYGQEMDGCGKFMKFSMFVANFVIFIGGCVVLSLGIWTLVDKSFVTELLGTNLFLGAAYTLVATGAAVCLVSFLGCIGSVREVRCMLLTYFIIVFAVFVTMMLGGILGYVFRERVEVTMRQEMLSSLRLYGNRREVTDAWDATQERLQCCGVYSADDWKTHVPESCCREPVPGKRQACQDLNTKGTRHEAGCLNITTMYVKDHAAVIGGAGIGVACLMILGMICSCALFKMIK